MTNKEGHKPHSGNKPPMKPNKLGENEHIHHMGGMLGLESLQEDKGAKKVMCNLFNIFKKKPDQQVIITEESNGSLVASGNTTNKYYVGVGINTYPNAPLNGCVNDIEDMFNMLTSKFGFKQGDDMRLLCDSRATKAEILNRLGWLVSMAKPGAICVFNYSGHGASLPHRKTSGEVDGIDECLCPYDFDWDNKFIIDDQLGAFADRIAAAGAIPVFIIDACHSGTILRDLPKKNARKFKNKFMQQPIDIAARVKENIRRKTVATIVQDNENAILIAGCQEDQTSADAYFGGRYNGALTYNLVKLLNKNQDITYGDLEPILAKMMSAGRFDQTPLVIAKQELLNRKVFN